MPATERRHYAGGAVATTITASINASVTTFAITDPTGWPDGSTGPFFAEIDYDLSTAEKVKVTSRSGSTLNGVTRGQDGTAAQGHTGANPKIRHVFVASDIDIVNRHAADSAQAALDHPNFLTTTTHDVTARHTVGTVIPAAAPGNSAVGQAATAGVANSVARSDHQHGREGFGSPSASNPGDASSDGVATTVARSDHKHAREASGGSFPGYGAAQDLGNTANGAASTVSRSDHVHGAATTSSFTPSWTAVTTNPTPSGTPFAACAYRAEGRRWFVNFHLSFTGGGAGSGVYTFGLPPGFGASRTQVLPAWVRISGTDYIGTAVVFVSGVTVYLHSGSSAGALSNSFPATFTGSGGDPAEVRFSGVLDST